MILVGFKTEALKPLTGKTLGDVARTRGKPPEEVVADLIVADDSRIQVVYFGMSEDNVAREVALPWMSFGSDAAAQAPEGVFLKSSTHPRAYGNFARLLGKYVRDEKRVPLAEAVRRLTALPGRQSRHRGPRASEARPLCRHRHLRSGRRSPTTPHSPSRSNMPSACATCSSTASPCSATASIPAPRPADSCAAPAGSAAASSPDNRPSPHNARRRGRGGFGRGGRRRR